MKVNVFVYVDALPLSSISPDVTPFLAHMKDDGETFVLENVMGYSFAIQSALLSGKLPSETGHWMPYFRSPNCRSNIKVISSIGRKINFRHDLPFPLRVMRWGIMEKLVLDTGAKTCSIPWKIIDEFCMHPYYYMNELVFFSEFRDELSEEWNTRLEYFGPPIRREPVGEAICRVKSLVDATDCSDEGVLLMVYLDSLDALGHKHGTKCAVWTSTLRDVDSKLNALYCALDKHFSEFSFSVFSDHGMADITQTIDFLGHLRANGVNLCDDVVVFVDATIAMVWLEDKSCKSAVLGALEKLGSDKVVVFDNQSDSEILRKYGVFFGDGCYGDLIVQTKPGYMFFPNFYSELAPFKATHGYLPEEKHQLSFLLSASRNSCDTAFKPCHIVDLKKYLLSLVAK